MLNLDTLSNQIFTELLTINAIKVSPKQPFQYASGMISPIYTDLRMTISEPKLRKLIVQGLTSLITNNFPEATVIAGVATAGIPHAAWVADALSLPLIYVRSKPKDHGAGKQIEGRLAPSDHVVLIDDLISTGGSVLNAVQAVRDFGANVDGVTSIFSYELPDANTNFSAAQTTLTPLLSYHQLLKHLAQKHELNDKELDLIRAWHSDPWHWKQTTL